MRPIVDVHVHIYPPRRLGGLMRWLHRAIPGHPVPVDVTVERAVAELRAAGVVRFLGAAFPLAPGEARELNAFLASLAREIPEMMPLATVHPADDDPAAVIAEALGPLGLKGIKLHPMMMRIDPSDRRLWPVYAAAQEKGVPLLVHTGFDEGYDHRIPAESWETLFRSFPRLTILLAHMFFPDLAYGFSLLRRFENVHLDLTNVPGLLLWPPGGPLPFGISRSPWSVGELCDAIEAHSGRVLFGSDHPAGMGSMEEIVGQAERLGLGGSTLDKVFHGNARRMLAEAGLD